MNKTVRQYIGLLAALVSYYIIHEGAHLVYALSIGVFKAIKFMGLGMQIDVYAEKMSQIQMGIFCICGSIATAVVAYLMVIFVGKIVKHPSKVFKAVMYYVTIALLLLDPVYLSVLYQFFGGGDMNGILFLIPEKIAQTGYGILLVINGLVFWKCVLPKYKNAFQE